MNDRQRLEAIINVIGQYLPPDGIPINDAMSEIIGLVDPLPPQRTWVGLDPEEIRKTNHHMVDGAYHYSFKQGAEWAEDTLKERNT